MHPCSRRSYLIRRHLQHEHRPTSQGRRSSGPATNIVSYRENGTVEIRRMEHATAMTIATAIAAQCRGDHTFGSDVRTAREAPRPQRG